MQRVRRGEHHRLHVLAGQHAAEAGRQLQRVLRGEFAGCVGLPDHRMGEPQAFALALHRLDEIPAPASEADYRGIDHTNSVMQ
ncbi:hypothetical protein D3C83_77200 [compost metagenome]